LLWLILDWGLALVLGLIWLLIWLLNRISRITGTIWDATVQDTIRKASKANIAQQSCCQRCAGRANGLHNTTPLCFCSLGFKKASVELQTLLACTRDRRLRFSVDRLNGPAGEIPFPKPVAQRNQHQAGSFVRFVLVLSTVPVLSLVRFKPPATVFSTATAAPLRPLLQSAQPATTRRVVRDKVDKVCQAGYAAANAQKSPQQGSLTVFGGGNY
jgi:hypothetical protein